MVAFGPSGQTALVGSNKTASLIDLVSGKVLGPEFAFPGLAYAVAMSPDGKTAAVAEFGSPNPEDSASWRSTVRLWEGRTGRAVTDPIRHPAAVTLEGVPGLIQAIGFSPDGKTLLTGSTDRTARRWDVVSGKEIGVPLPIRPLLQPLAIARTVR